MDFELDHSQRMLEQSLTRLLGDRYSFEARRAYLESPRGWSEELWSEYARLGLLALPFAESDGGVGGGPVETMIVMQAIGRVAALEPYLPSAVLGAAALRFGAREAQKAELLPRVMSGQSKLAFCHYERCSRYDADFVSTGARAARGGWIIQGLKTDVPGGDSADFLLVSARIAGQEGDDEGMALFLVRPDAPGVSRRTKVLRDNSRAADVELDEVWVGEDAALGALGGTTSIVRRINEIGLAAVAAEAVGAMEAILEFTLSHLRTRRQFGRTLGSFQVLQHRAAEMYVEVEQARSLAVLGAAAVAENDADERAHLLSTVKAGVGAAAKFLCQQGIQLHGGMGMTDEHPVGHLYRRLMVIEHSFGDTAYHLEQVARRIA